MSMFDLHTHLADLAEHLAGIETRVIEKIQTSLRDAVGPALGRIGDAVASLRRENQDVIYELSSRLEEVERQNIILGQQLSDLQRIVGDPDFEEVPVIAERLVAATAAATAAAAEPVPALTLVPDTAPPAASDHQHDEALAA